MTRYEMSEERIARLMTAYIGHGGALYGPDNQYVGDLSALIQALEACSRERERARAAYVRYSSDMFTQLSGARNERDSARSESLALRKELTARTVKLIGHACEEHTKEVLAMGFPEFLDKHPPGCEWCMAAELDSARAALAEGVRENQQLSADVRDLRSGMEALRAERDALRELKCAVGLALADEGGPPFAETIRSLLKERNELRFLISKQRDGALLDGRD